MDEIYDMESMEVLEEMQSILNKWLGKESSTALVTVSSDREVQNIAMVVMLVVEALLANKEVSNITNHPGLNKFIQDQIDLTIA